MKKILSVIFFLATYCFLLSAYAVPAFAGEALTNEQKEQIRGGSWFVQDPATWQRETFADNPELMTAQRYGVFMVTNLLNTGIAALGGVETEVQTTTGMIKQRQGGIANTMAGVVTNMTAGPPVSSVEYLADLGNNLGIVKPAYAQGIGFNAFSPVLKIWKAFRDIAYLGFVVFFVIIGFMIMFRKKIDPRTVVTIQEALPRIVVTLILITFSYAIIGLMVDGCEFLIRLIGKTLSDMELIAVSGSPTDRQRVLDTLYSQNIFPLINALANTDNLSKAIQGSGAPLVDAPVLGKVTLDFIFSMASIFVMFKVFFALLGPYVGIILSVIFSPLQLLLTALPGSQSSVGSWIKDLLSKILVFPVTFALLAIAAYIKGRSANPWFGPAANWDVPGGKFGVSWSPATIGNWGSAVGDLIAFGILFTIPQVTEAIKAAFQIKGGPMEGAAGAEIKGVASKIPIVGSFLGGVMK